MNSVSEYYNKSFKWNRRQDPIRMCALHKGIGKDQGVVESIKPVNDYEKATHSKATEWIKDWNPLETTHTRSKVSKESLVKDPIYRMKFLRGLVCDKEAVALVGKLDLYSKKIRPLYALLSKLKAQRDQSIHVMEDYTFSIYDKDCLAYTGKGVPVYARKKSHIVINTVRNAYHNLGDLSFRSLVRMVDRLAAQVLGELLV